MIVLVERNLITNEFYLHNRTVLITKHPITICDTVWCSQHHRMLPLNTVSCVVNYYGKEYEYSGL